MGHRELRLAFDWHTPGSHHVDHRAHSLAMAADTWEIKPDFLLLDWGGACSPGSPVGWSSSVSLSLASEDFSSQLSPVYPPSISVVKFQCVLTSLPMSVGINYCLGNPPALSPHPPSGLNVTLRSLFLSISPFLHSHFPFEYL